MNTKITRWFAAAAIGAIALGAASLAWASGVGGCFAIIEKVVLEPNDTAPERIQIWGAFALNDGKPGSGFLPVQRGYMYFAIPGETVMQLRQGTRVPQRNIALAEWSDLKKLAGSGQIVSIAERTVNPDRVTVYFTARVYKSSEKPQSSEAYPLYNGITVLPESNLLTPALVAELKEALKKK